MKILLLGKNGQVGWELQRSLAPLGEVLALDSKSSDYCGDLRDLDGLAATVQRFAPDVIVNAAAYTAVDKAESEPENAQRVNAEAVAVLAREARQLGSLLVHYSTDYVFAGDGEQPWAEEDAVAPLNQYGASKLAGEQAIQASGCQHLILRTSWVVSAHGTNFVKTMLRLGRERSSLTVVADQIGGPTPASDIADALYKMAVALRTGAKGGVQHFSGAPDTSWADFARVIMARAGLPCAVVDIASSAYPTPAKRPLNSRLDCTGLAEFGLQRPDWRVGLDKILQELAA